MTPERASTRRGFATTGARTFRTPEKINGVENAAGHERYRYADEEEFDREEEAYERGERAGGYRY